MIVADTSAFAGIILREADADRFVAAIGEASRVLVSAPSAFELRLVVRHKLGSSYLPAADLLLGAPHIEIVAWEASHVGIATEALIRFGGRPARLNFGDCMTYAVAKSRNLPLLFKGGDFARTDIRPAL